MGRKYISSQPNVLGLVRVTSLNPRPLSPGGGSVFQRNPRREWVGLGSEEGLRRGEEGSWTDRPARVDGDREETYEIHISNWLWGAVCMNREHICRRY